MAPTTMEVARPRTERAEGDGKDRVRVLWIEISVVFFGTGVTVLITVCFADGETLLCNPARPPYTPSLRSVSSGSCVPFTG